MGRFVICEMRSVASTCSSSVPASVFCVKAKLTLCPNVIVINRIRFQEDHQLTFPFDFSECLKLLFIEDNKMDWLHLIYHIFTLLYQNELNCAFIWQWYIWINSSFYSFSMSASMVLQVAGRAVACARCLWVKTGFPIRFTCMFPFC